MLRHEVAPNRFNQCRVCFKSIKCFGERPRNSDGGVNRVKAVAALWRSRIGVSLSTETRRLQHRRHCRVHDRGAIAEAVLKSSPFATLAGYSNGGAPVVIAPVRPVARQRRRSKALIRVDRRREQSRKRTVVIDETTD